MNNKYLYNIIMRNVSKEVKRALNEGIQQFDVTEYDEPESVVFQDVRNITKIENIDTTIFDWLTNAIQYIEENDNLENIYWSIYKSINRNVEKILNYDEYSLGELVKNAIKKGMMISADTLNEINSCFDTWIEEKIENMWPEPFLDFNTFKEYVIDYQEDFEEKYESLNFDDIKEMSDEELKSEWKKYLIESKEVIMNDISDFIDEYEVSNKIVEILTHKNNDYPTFQEWLDKWIDTYDKQVADIVNN